MSLATTLLGAAAACLLCCALPLTSLVSVGVLEISAAAWGIGAGVISLVAAAVVLTWAKRNSRIQGKHLFDAKCSCGGMCDEENPSLTEHIATSETSNAPIACTLAGGEYQARVRWIQELAKQSLPNAWRTPITLHLIYERGALSKVRQMVREEQRCCAFLTFRLTEEVDGVHLSITAPRTASAAADVLFSHFAPDAIQHQN